MILIDRIIRYIRNDIMLPDKCYSRNKLKMNERCECKIFCRKNYGKPVKITVNVYKEKDI